MSQPDIKVYSGRFCGYCVAAERLLKGKGLEYEVIKAEEEREKFEQMMQETGSRSVPQIFIGERHVGGFDDLSALNQSGELDQILSQA